MPYPPLSSLYLQPPEGPYGPRPWRTWHFREPRQARTLESWSLLLFSLRPFRGRTAFGRGHSLLQGCHLVRGPCNTHIILVNFIATKTLFCKVTIQSGVTHLLCPRAASWHGRALARTARGPASKHRPPQSVRQRSAAQPATHIDIICSNPAYIFFFQILSPAFLSEHRTEHQGLLSMRYYIAYFYLLTSKPDRRLLQALVSPLLASCTF